MKCPKCDTDLVKQSRYGMEVDYCDNCHGMWLDFQELDLLEDREFSDDDYKGTLIFSGTATSYRCPHCKGELKQFQYRLHDLTLEYCESKHGFWLDTSEEKRVVELMQQRAKGMERKLDAETEWKTALRRLRSPSFIRKLMNLFK